MRHFSIIFIILSCIFLFFINCGNPVQPLLDSPVSEDGGVTNSDVTEYSNLFTMFSVYSVGIDDLNKGNEFCKYSNSERFVYSSQICSTIKGLRIEVTNSTTYIAGTDMSNSFYFVNNTEMDLSYSGGFSCVDSLYINNNSVYVGGRVKSDFKWRACYWKDSILHSLEIINSNENERVTGFFIKDGNSYAFKSSDGSLESYLGYWKNGFFEMLNSSFAYGGVDGYFQDINSLYFVGTFVEGVTNNYYQVGFWKDNTFTRVSDVTDSFLAEKIYVSSDVVYVLYRDIRLNWFYFSENGTVSLEVPDGTSEISSILDFKVLDGNVYAVGVISDFVNITSSCAYWVNGVYYKVEFENNYIWEDIALIEKE